ncbi:hypothetical protein [Herbaspirillum frisingense]|uniref:hypothetical protein n=1 Tax=Herbaspirillum frisingense TaxID=92645 RepID=UPI001F3F7952|nr:hypothetical protein [Herbaspirillum frisingense]UIN20801.1 hypothetical protein LAZ82_20380 [Herbaspirillum frisingense]
MKSQDIFLLLKLISLDHRERGISRFLESKWEDWELELDPTREEAKMQSLRSEQVLREQIHSQYTVRALAESTGISKSEVGLSLQRCYEISLAKPDRQYGIPRVNLASLEEFIAHGIRYVFPAKPEQLTRGIATAYASPALRDLLGSGGEIIPVWPDAKGNSRGQAIQPLYKTVPMAVRHDATLYELLAVVDAIRIGQPRERNLAIKLLPKFLRGQNGSR